MVFISSYTSASSPVVISDLGNHRLSQEIEYVFDDSYALEIAEIQNVNGWSAVTSSSVNFGFKSSALWLRFSVAVTNSEDYILHIPYPLIDYLDNFSFINGKALAPIMTGDARNFNTRNSDFIDFVFPYRLKKGDTLTVYLRAETSGALDIPIDFLSKAMFTEKERGNSFFRGIVSGILWLMLFYNIFIYAAIKDRVYFFYVVHVFACMVTSYAYDGAAFQYVWPNNPELNDYIFPIFNGLIQVTSIVFMLELLQVLKVKTWYRSYFLGLLGIVSFFPLLGGLLPYSKIVPVEVVFSLLVNASSLILGIHLSFKGNKSAQYFTVAVSLFMVGLVSNNLKSLGLLPNNFFTQHAYQIGFFVEMVVLSLALAQKIDTTKKQLILAQNESIVNLNRYKELYSESVSGNFQIKTSGEVMSANKAFCQIIGFSSIDALMASDVSKSISDISVDRDIPSKLLEIIKEKGKLVDFEDQVKHLDGKNVWVSLSMRPVVTHNNEVEYFEGSMIDITERKVNEGLKEQALKDKMNTQEQLIIGICHELNTPLGTSITGLSHIKDLINNLTSSFEEKTLTLAIFQDIISEEIESVQFTEENLSRIRSLLNQFKHISVNQLDYKASNDTIFNTIESGIERNKKTIDDKRVKITINCDVNLKLYSYHQAISEVMHQLTSNSLDHGFDEGSKNNINISVTKDDDKIVIEYQDNGSGLSEKGKKEMFNPFYTTMRGSQGKIGLGMYLTYNIITQLLDGTVDVEPVDSGIHLKLLLPIMKP